MEDARKIAGNGYTLASSDDAKAHSYLLPHKYEMQGQVDGYIYPSSVSTDSSSNEDSSFPSGYSLARNVESGSDGGIQENETYIVPLIG